MRAARLRLKTPFHSTSPLACARLGPFCCGRTECCLPKCALISLTGSLDARSITCDDGTCVLDELAVVVIVPQSAKGGFSRVMIVFFPNERLQVLCRLGAVVCNCQEQLVSFRSASVGERAKKGHGRAAPGSTNRMASLGKSGG